MEAFQRYLCSGFFRSQSFRTKGNQKYYDFDFQHACLTFAGAVNDAGFECLALAEIRYAWAGGTYALGLNSLHKLLVLVPLTDDILLTMRESVLEEPHSKCYKDYELSKLMYPDSWQELDKRLAGQDACSSTTIAAKVARSQIPTAGSTFRSHSAAVVDKILRDIKKVPVVTDGKGAGKASTIRDDLLSNKSADNAEVAEAGQTVKASETVDLEGLGNRERASDGDGNTAGKQQGIQSERGMRSPKRALASDSALNDVSGKSKKVDGSRGEDMSTTNEIHRLKQVRLAQIMAKKRLATKQCSCSQRSMLLPLLHLAVTRRRQSQHRQLWGSQQSRDVD